MDGGDLGPSSILVWVPAIEGFHEFRVRFQGVHVTRTVMFGHIREPFMYTKPETPDPKS